MKHSSWSEFARKVDEVRRQQHLSIRQFGLAAGVPKATAQGWLNGRHVPTPALRRRFLAAIAELGLSEEFPDGIWAETIAD